MGERLKGKKFAVLVTNGFEQSELEEPINAIREEGGVAEIVSPNKPKVRGWKSIEWGDEFPVDCELSKASPDDYDGLVLPGGVMNPDQLRKDQQAVDFVKGFFGEQSKKPVAAICHGPWTLIEAGQVKGRKMTSYNSLRTDLINAGAKWEDAEVVVDKGLVTSRSPKDLRAFNAKMVEEFCEGRHENRL